MRRKNPFKRTTQYYVDDGENISWWVDEDELEEFKQQWCSDNGEDGPKWEDIFKGKTRELSGKEWNDWMIGSPWGDYEGTIIDKDCPLCGCFLVNPDEGGYHSDSYDGSEEHCSNYDCDYKNQKMVDALAIIATKRKEDAETPPLPEFREPGQTVEEFAEKYGICLETKEKNPPVCTQCKNITSVSDFYRTKDCAIIIYGKGHAEDCKNKDCPALLVPLGKQREFWRKIF